MPLRTKICQQRAALKPNPVPMLVPIPRLVPVCKKVEEETSKSTVGVVPKKVLGLERSIVTEPLWEPLNRVGERTCVVDVAKIFLER
jgi:hypothetical protein